MSGILLVLVTPIKTGYEWNRKEWIWKNSLATSEGSGDHVDSEDRDYFGFGDEDDDFGLGYGDEDDDYHDYDDFGFGYRDEYPPWITPPSRKKLEILRNNLGLSSIYDQITPPTDMNSDERTPAREINWQTDRDDPIIVDLPQTTFPSLDDHSSEEIYRPDDKDDPILVDPPHTTFPHSVDNILNETDRQADGDDLIIVDSPQRGFPSPVENNNNETDRQRNMDDPNIVYSTQTTFQSAVGWKSGWNVPRNKNNFETTSPASFIAEPITMAAIIGGAIVGVACVILCAMLVVYCTRKKYEGSKSLDESKRSPTVNSYAETPRRGIDEESSTPLNLTSN